MDYGNFKILIFSENPLDFQEWKINFITSIGLRKIRHLVDNKDPTSCLPTLNKIAEARVQKNGSKLQNSNTENRRKIPSRYFT
jgi:hypothetical protein